MVESQTYSISMKSSHPVTPTNKHLLSFFSCNVSDSVLVQNRNYDQFIIGVNITFGAKGSPSDSGNPLCQELVSHLAPQVSLARRQVTIQPQPPQQTAGHPSMPQVGKVSRYDTSAKKASGQPAKRTMSQSTSKAHQVKEEDVLMISIRTSRAQPNNISYIGRICNHCITIYQPPSKDPNYSS